MPITDLSPPPPLAPDVALFLDFDGTLVELAEAPDAISVPHHLPRLLTRLGERLDGRIGIISGRALADLERHLDCRGFAVSGSHGAELRLGDGTSLPVETPESLSAARIAVRALATRFPLLIVEEKPAGIAVHYRRVPEAQDAVIALMTELAEGDGFVLQRGKMVAELRPRGADKGAALRRLMREPKFAGARPLFVGDDLTDEDAFAAAASINGAGILVGPPRKTAARWRLADVAAVAAWLEEGAR
ncbi:trehalose-phosphatase [Allosphingosinicella indica]|uniref:Trehalose 6-phosphate phosphatase n=1 Tax=Allosphingosinicella indica TaxID=941907 RepID=A0A1X7H2K5_9SPHN|nr:trehalose-phosphatase [Allosphingosinicella indica]SMF78487.1 trehalose 6-phosphate phosphatase [Allosphingosinicella indica]